MANTGTTAFPATLDAFTGLGTARKEDEAGYAHVSMHNQDQAAVLALQVAVGTTQGTGVLTNFVAGNLAAKTANETFGTPTLQDGTAGTLTLEDPIIDTPAVTDGTATNVRTVPTLGTATDGATVTFNLATKQIWTVSLGGNRTLALSNPTVGQPFVIRLKQDGSTRTVTWFSTINWSDDTEPTLSTGANTVDVFGFICTATGVYDGYIIGEGLDES